MPASHIIINNTYLYPLSCLIYQYISHHTPDGIILKNIELHVDMFRSLLQLAQQGLEHGKPSRIDFHTVSVKRKCLVSITEQGDETAVIHRKYTRVLGKIFRHRLLQQTVVALLPDDTYTPLTTTEEEVKHKPR